MRLDSKLPPFALKLVLAGLAFGLTCVIVQFSGKTSDPRAPLLSGLVAAALVLFAGPIRRSRLFHLDPALPPAKVWIIAGLAFAVCAGLPWLLGGYVPPQILILVGLIPATFVLHVGNLMLNPRLDTHSARRSGVVFMLTVTLQALLLITQNHPPNSDEPGVLLTSLAVFLGALIILPAMWVFAMPASLLSLIPLILPLLLLPLLQQSPQFAMAGLFIMMFAGWYFPKHRRMASLWRPGKLPRIRRAKSGLTLIELLIVVAIIAIISGGLGQSSMAMHRAIQRQEDRRAAMDLAENQIALLRARGALPEIGTHPVDAALAGAPFADSAEVRIAAGPDEKLREVRVTIRIRGDASDRDVTLAAILPAEGAIR